MWSPREPDQGGGVCGGGEDDDAGAVRAGAPEGADLVRGLLKGGAARGGSAFSEEYDLPNDTLAGVCVGAEVFREGRGIAQGGRHLAIGGSAGVRRVGGAGLCCVTNAAGLVCHDGSRDYGRACPRGAAAEGSGLGLCGRACAAGVESDGGPREPADQDAARWLSSGLGDVGREAGPLRHGAAGRSAGYIAGRAGFSTSPESEVACRRGPSPVDFRLPGGN